MNATCETAHPMSTPIPTASRRAPGLDLLRAVAIAWTMLFHAAIFGLVGGGPPWVRFGWMGVDLFFVLSGFLIAGPLLRRPLQFDGRAYGRFMARRLLRTVPAYLVVVAIYFAWPWLGESTSIRPLWRFLTFTFNLGLQLPTTFSHAWSLSVEEQFYLVLPLVLALVAMRPHRHRALGLMLAIVFGGMAIRGYLWLAAVASPPYDATATPRDGAYMTLIYYPTWSRLDGLLAGVAAAALQARRPEAWAWCTARANGLTLAGLGAVGAAMLLFGDQIGSLAATIAGYPLVALGMGLLVIAASEPRSWLARARVPGAAALATGAYSLYLAHKMVFHAIAARGAAIGAATPLVALVAALAAGAFLYFAVERPFLRLRDRLFSR
jgi:peptidoglycan/LPS O-acetylase OafA/YrhL